MEREDLRIVKTRKALKGTFLDMRKEMPLEKIRVRELCKRALVNKSTFYNHYEDIYQLSEEMENEAIRTFLNHFEAKGCLLSDPQRFLSEMPAAFDANMKLLDPLFRDRFDVAFLKLEQQLKKIYITSETSAEEEIRVTFLLNGALHTLRELKYGQKYEDAMLANIIAGFIAAVRAEQDKLLQDNKPDFLHEHLSPY